MSRIRSLFGLLALIGALTAVYSSSASAEFFGCNDRRGQVLYSYSGTPDGYVRRQHRTYSAPRYSSQYSTLLCRAAAIAGMRPITAIRVIGMAASGC